MWCMGLVALRHVESSRTRDQTHVPCMDKRILIHCTAREDRKAVLLDLPGSPQRILLKCREYFGVPWLPNIWYISLEASCSFNDEFDSSFESDFWTLKSNLGTSLVVQWLRLHVSNTGEPGSIPGQGTRSHRLQLRLCRPQLKILQATTKTQHSQINE